MKSAMERYQEGAICPQCGQNNQKYQLKFMFISLDEMVLKCESSSCLYPFKDFIYKNVKDGTISQPHFIAEQKPADCNTNLTIPEPAQSSFIDAFVDSLTFDNQLGGMEDKKTFVTLQPAPMTQYHPEPPLNYEIVEAENNRTFIELAPLQISMPKKQTGSNKIDQELPKPHKFLNKVHSNVKNNMIHSITSAVPQQELFLKSASNVCDQKPTTSQLQSSIKTKNETTATATISRYLDLIKAKHKKGKTSKTAPPSIKVEKEAKILNTTQNSSQNFPFPGTDKGGSRPLDILKSIQGMK